MSKDKNMKDTLPTKAEEKEIEKLVEKKESAEGKDLKKEIKEAQTKNLSLNAESKGFGTEEHIEDIKKRQAEGCEVSLDEENLLKYPPE